MNKILGSIFLAFTVISCNNINDNSSTTSPIKVEYGKSVNTDAFNNSFEQVLNSYYALKDAFVKEDSVAITKAGNALIVACDSLKLGELKVDEAIAATAKQNTESLSSEIKGILGEKNIDEQRKDFHLVSNDIYALIRTVRYDKAMIYFQHCPMAFDNKGADWISTSNEILNPYMPKKMLDCGVNKDSVDFRPIKQL